MFGGEGNLHVDMFALVGTQTRPRMSRSVLFVVQVVVIVDIGKYVVCNENEGRAMKHMYWFEFPRSPRLTHSLFVRRLMIFHFLLSTRKKNKDEQR